MKTKTFKGSHCHDKMGAFIRDRKVGHYIIDAYSSKPQQMIRIKYLEADKS